MPVCKKCGGRKEIVVDMGSHVDINPCEECLEPLSECCGGSRPDPHPRITFRGHGCPLCAALRELAIVADTEQIARRIRDVLEQKL